MEQERKDTDTAQALRHLRFSQLPERIRLEDMIEERPAATHDSVSGAFNSDWWLLRMGGV
ncbi:hypothetical protein ACFVXE_22655 [Streptomyces sp. NPDC058231]|uniref:hypothetical protein n=1 Tax=unclassified Streptomyces TaxID=2593676 RepID=UPI0036F0AA88